VSLFRTLKLGDNRFIERGKREGILEGESLNSRDFEVFRADLGGVFDRGFYMFHTIDFCLTLGYTYK